MSDDAKSMDDGSLLSKITTGKGNDSVIEAGTLAVTRTTGWVAAAFTALWAALQALDPDSWKDIDLEKRVWMLIGAGAVWAIVAGTDAIARGIATAKQNAPVATMPKGLKVSRPAMPSDNEDEWNVVAVRWEKPDADPQWLIAKDNEVKWVETSDIDFGKGN